MDVLCNFVVDYFQVLPLDEKKRRLLSLREADEYVQEREYYAEASERLRKSIHKILAEYSTRMATEKKETKVEVISENKFCEFMMSLGTNEDLE